MNCNQSVETQYIGELPVDTLISLPDYFLAERDVMEESTGNVKRSIVRVPTGKVFPHANTDNIFGVEINNVAIEVPENQVRAVYVKNTGSAYEMDYADADHAPVMLALGKTNDQIMMCQNCGVINIPERHNYIVGQQYYVGDDGEPVTDSTSGLKLFIPISDTQLAVNLYGA